MRIGGNRTAAAPNAQQPMATRRTNAAVPGDGLKAAVNGANNLRGKAAQKHLLNGGAAKPVLGQPRNGQPVAVKRLVAAANNHQVAAGTHALRPVANGADDSDVICIDSEEEEEELEEMDIGSGDVVDNMIVPRKTDLIGAAPADKSAVVAPTSLKHPSNEQKALFVKVRTRFCERPANIPDIYEEDGGNEQMMTAYVHHIFDYLHDIEASFTLPPKWLEGSDIQPRMRAILIDWMVSLHLKFRMQVDTLYLAVDLLDRFLALDDVNVTKDELQLVGVTCLFTASKFEEIYPPDVADYVYMADGACTKSDVLAMEMVVLHKLQFSLNAPLACKFLRRYAKAAESDTREYGIAKYILEMTLLAPDMTCYKASFKASAAQFTAMLLLENYRHIQASAHEHAEHMGPQFKQPTLTSELLTSLWTPTMVFYSTYSVDDLVALVKKYLIMLETANSNNKYQALRKKYSQDNFCKISSMEELQSLHVVSLTAAVEAYIQNFKAESAAAATRVVPVAVAAPTIAASIVRDSFVMDMSINDDGDSNESSEAPPSQEPSKKSIANINIKNGVKPILGGAAAGLIKPGLQMATKTALAVRPTNRAVAVKR